MDEINVHVYTSGVHSMNHKVLVGHFLVECIKDGKLYTYPGENKNTFETWENTTPSRVTAYLLTRAVNIVSYYLTQTEGIEKITVYMEPHSGPALHKPLAGEMGVHGISKQARPRDKEPRSLGAVQHLYS